MNIIYNIRHICYITLLWLALPMTAHATLIGSTFGYNINASVGNPITSNDFPLSGVQTAVAGQDFSQSAQLVFTSSGFPQTFTGTVSFDLEASSITVGFSGTAQGVGLSFDFTGLNWGAISGTIEGISLASQTCSAAGGGCNGIASFLTPTFTSDSVTGMGMNMFGFQPNFSFSQTYNLEVSHDQGGGDVPEPATIALLGLGLAGLSYRRKRLTAV